MNNSFDARTELAVGNKTYEIFSCARLADRYPVDRLPFAQKILLENLLRFEDGINVFLGRSLSIGILDAQDELPVMVPGIEPAKQRGAHAAEMENAGGAGGETGAYSHESSGPS